MPLFNRVALVDIGEIGGEGFRVEGFRVDFDILKSDKSEANYGRINIYNLGSNTRSKIRKLNDNIIVRAGYSEDTGPLLIFQGQITQIEHSRSTPNIITKIEAGDGIGNLREERDSFSFGSGTNVTEIVTNISSKFGLPVRDFKDAIAGITDQYLGGFAYIGPVREALNKVTERAGLSWSIQNGEIQIIKKGGFQPGTIIEINRNTGLLIKPEKIDSVSSNYIEEDALKKAGLKLTTLLNPRVEPGSKIYLNDFNINSFFRVSKVNHKGDLFGEAWTSEIEMSEL